jgi:L-fucose mutarotase
MLKGIDPILNAELVYALASMGHGDEIVLVDTNFPAASAADSTVVGAPIFLNGVSLARAAQAVLSLMPLDTFVDDPARRMDVVGAPGEIPPVQHELQAVIDAAERRPVPIVGMERFAFYEAAKSAYCIVQTGERRFYGNVILRKGVVPPDAP